MHPPFPTIPDEIGRLSPRLLLYCALCFLSFLAIPDACEASAVKKRIVVLDARIENDIGVQNAGPITTRWLIDSILAAAPDARIVPAGRAAKLSRIKLPARAGEISRGAAKTLMKAIDSTHILGCEIFIWKQKYGITLRLIELPDVGNIRIERAWAAEPEDIPGKIEELALVLFAPSEPGSIKRKPAPSAGYEPPPELGGAALSKDGIIPPGVHAVMEKHPEMVYIPGGEFFMGNDNDSDADNIPADPSRREGVSRLTLLAAESPKHKVNLRPFLMDKYEVTNSEYKKFRTSHEFSVGRADHPVTGISWHDARAFAGWAGKRLPTEQEWERAARGPDGWKWPWGNIFERNRCNLGAGTAPVGSFSGDKSPFGVFDMAGNVQEWTSSQFIAYEGAGKDGNLNGGLGGVAFDAKKKVVRGSYYGGNDFLARNSMRYCSLPGEPGNKPQGSNYEYIGFRCALDADGTR
jgi:formylglycine-generating enzyme required for sulfatase activity